MTKIDIFSGFLGAGKTTLIKKLIKEAYSGEKIVLIENEFGEIGIDGGFMQDAGIEVTEMNSGCICCSLVGDFGKALKEVLEKFKPDRILIEPSGVGKLSDVIRAVEKIDAKDAVLSSFTTVADVNKCRLYMKNFGEFFNDQIEHAGAIILSHTQSAADEKISQCVSLLREHNADAVIVTTPWDKLTGAQLAEAMERKDTLDAALEKLKDEEVCPVCGHHHDHDEHAHHHHHHDGEECDDPECSCHHHHADDVFASWGKETPKKFTREALEEMLRKLDSGDYGHILRAKGIVNGEDGWLEFDYVPEEHEVRAGHPDYTGRLCVIGAELKENGLAELFGV